MTNVVAMARAWNGWHEVHCKDAKPGTLDRFSLPDGSRVPDPASRYQPFDVHGPSEVIDPHAFAWSDGAWKGRPWEETVIYELHLGASGESTGPGWVRGVSFGQ